MTLGDSEGAKMLPYPSRTVERAQRSLLCSPFYLRLFQTMRWESVPLKAIAGDSGLQQGYSKRSLSELAVENTLLWLIQVGLLRREVDGQGITDSFRLTPLGRQLVEQYQGNCPHTATLLDHFYNALSRWFRLPF